MMGLGPVRKRMPDCCFDRDHSLPEKSGDYVNGELGGDFFPRQGLNHQRHVLTGVKYLKK